MRSIVWGLVLAVLSGVGASPAAGYWIGPGGEETVHLQSRSPSIETEVVRIITEIKRADYEGDRTALRHLYDELAPFVDDKAIGDKIHYWRGFALWRRAFNGTTASANEIEDDLILAAAQFEKAVARNSGFVDAKIAAASCYQNISALHYLERDISRAKELMEKSFPLLREAEADDPDNPRLLWVLGAYRFYNPPERGGGQQFAIETYRKGLETFRGRHTVRAENPLTPSWGEPELLMSLAFSSLNQKTPDLAAAEQYAQQALELVPYWHYVRDVLMPQIRNAKSKKL